ncbi:hypothetical protein LOD99_4800 [Oopsacas minuta]|uniref:Uncharacterized protein n=1 Tax=Oopsacas minuta TaxID=111878 RepID=A0AAV7JSN7_9METZ|nr:hypothetical protein LOD99_4800 [Oopsacas minuta]
MNSRQNLRPIKPIKSLIFLWVRKLKTGGKLNDLRPKTPGHGAYSGRKKLCDTAVKEQIRNDVIASPSRSTRKRSKALVIPRASLMRLMKEDIHLLRTHEQLKTNIVLEITVKSKDVLKSVFENFALRLKNVQECNGHIVHLL